jgi:hypothetical protein
MDSTHSDRAPCSAVCSAGAGTWQAAEGLRVPEQIGACSVLQKHSHPGRGAPPSRCLLSSLYLFLFIWNKGKESMSQPNKDMGETVFQGAGTNLEQRRNNGTAEQRLPSPVVLFTFLLP